MSLTSRAAEKAAEFADDWGLDSAQRADLVETLITFARQHGKIVASVFNSAMEDDEGVMYDYKRKEQMLMAAEERDR